MKNYLSIVDRVFRSNGFFLLATVSGQYNLYEYAHGNMHPIWGVLGFLAIVVFGPESLWRFIKWLGATE